MGGSGAEMLEQDSVTLEALSLPADNEVASLAGPSTSTGGAIQGSKLRLITPIFIPTETSITTSSTAPLETLESKAEESMEMEDAVALKPLDSSEGEEKDYVHPSPRSTWRLKETPKCWSRLLICPEYPACLAPHYPSLPNTRDNYSISSREQMSLITIVLFMTASGGAKSIVAPYPVF